MGAENSILEGCEWGSQIDCPPKFPWQMSPVTKPDGTSGTVLTSKSSDKKNEELLQKFASVSIFFMTFSYITIVYTVSLCVHW